MAIGRTTLTDDDGTGTIGTIINNTLWQSAIYDAVDGEFADWAAVTYNGGAFGASSGSGTVDAGDVLLNFYQVVNKTLLWTVYLQTTSVSATPTNLLIQIPTGTFRSNLNQCPCTFATDNGTTREANASPSTGTTLAITRRDGSPWAASTNNTAIVFTVVLVLN